MPIRTRHEQKAIGLYAVLARDASDFVEMLDGTEVEALQVLHEMLTHVGPLTPREDLELNALGADVVSGNLRKRGAEPRFARPGLPPFED